MKKTLAWIVLPTVILSLTLPVFIQAQDELPYGQAPLVNLDIWTLLFKALNWFFNIVLIIAAIFLIYGGFLYITAGGDQAKTQKALNTVIYALIGVAIALLAKALINFVSKFVIERSIITQ